jgi:hypothetical protein
MCAYVSHSNRTIRPIRALVKRDIMSPAHNTVGNHARDRRLGRA